MLTSEQHSRVSGVTAKIKEVCRVKRLERNPLPRASQSRSTDWAPYLSYEVVCSPVEIGGAEPLDIQVAGWPSESTEARGRVAPHQASVVAAQAESPEFGLVLRIVDVPSANSIVDILEGHGLSVLSLEAIAIEPSRHLALLLLGMKWEDVEEALAIIEAVPLCAARRTFAIGQQISQPCSFVIYPKWPAEREHRHAHQEDCEVSTGR